MLEGSAADLEAWLAGSFSRELTGSYDGLKLGPLRQVLARLPTPPAPVTIAGTKGKGSTLRLLEALLLGHGEHTLAFTSPHLRCITERWRIDGVPVAPELACAAAREVAAAETACQATLTYFERCFAIAVLLAAQDPTRQFLCEVGLGGRLDCANALDAKIAICTHLSRDHCQVLGSTVAAIAGEKLAIARPDRPLLIAPQSPAARTAVARRLAEPEQPWSSAEVVWIEPDPVLKTWPLALLGEHQRENLATAVHAAGLLLGARFDPARARAAVAELRLAARCQLLSVEPWGEVVVDGAHNGPSIAATLAVARARWPDGFTLILGCATDKELDEILASIPADQPVIRCGYQGPRARGPQAWGQANAWPWQPEIQAALAAAPRDRPCCITGSFYLAAEALRALGASDDLPG